MAQEHFAVAIFLSNLGVLKMVVIFAKRPQVHYWPIFHLMAKNATTYLTEPPCTGVQSTQRYLIGN
ncbi:MAG TPA: hypothetical protein DIW77_10040 [Chromatiaceae bacterium]|nr:MAG: hypothetical protein N838_24175 [Thiohalocapsa sp. PB-PSB1]HCS90372.1 hypothetical protein [Chromatiaceae bacterium]